MRLRDLGTLVVEVGGSERPVSGSRAPAILALLVIHANRRVSAEALMAAAWGDQISSGAASTLESHVWRLRQLLEPGRSRGAPPTVLINDAGGYRLLAAENELDSARFTALGTECRDLLAAGDADRALTVADDALMLWRGRPYGNFADQEWAAPAVARLSEVREQLLERPIDALAGRATAFGTALPVVRRPTTLRQGKTGVGIVADRLSQRYPPVAVGHR